jgi:hypothetical protein
MTLQGFFAWRAQHEKYSAGTVKFFPQAFFIVSQCDINVLLQRTNHMMK